MFNGLATVAPVISALLIFTRLVFTIGLNYLTSILVFYLLFIIYASPATLLISER